MLRASQTVREVTFVSPWSLLAACVGMFSLLAWLWFVGVTGVVAPLGEALVASRASSHAAPAPQTAAPGFMTLAQAQE